MCSSFFANNEKNTFRIWKHVVIYISNIIYYKNIFETGERLWLENRTRD